MRRRRAPPNRPLRPRHADSIRRQSFEALPTMRTSLKGLPIGRFRKAARLQRRSRALPYPKEGPGRPPRPKRVRGIIGPKALPHPDVTEPEVLPRPERCCAPTLPSHTPNVTEPGTLPHPDAARPIRPIRRIRCRVQYDPTSQGRRIPEHCELQALPWHRPQPCRAISQAR